LECCDKQLRKDLTKKAGGTLAEMSEDEIITAMKRLAVREENSGINTMVHSKGDRSYRI
jgi:hypothetical protein